MKPIAFSARRAQMEQQIRFCTTSDGVRIAYATVGRGSPLVMTPTSWESVRFRLEEPSREGD